MPDINLRSRPRNLDGQGVMSLERCNHGGMVEPVVCFENSRRTVSNRTEVVRVDPGLTATVKTSSGRTPCLFIELYRGEVLRVDLV